MRTRAFVALTTGALALTAVTVPAAHAAGGSTGPKISNVSVNGGKDVVVGVAKKTFTVKFTVKHSSPIYDAIAAMWRGPNEAVPERMMFPDIGLEHPCKKVNSTTSTCSFKLVADPKESFPEGDLKNVDTGRWNLMALVEDSKGNETQKMKAATALVKRAAKATVNASPEPVKKGKTLTITGALTRANWDTNKYGGFASGAVKLQFKKKGTSRWTPVKTVSADSRGKVKTSVKASADGSYRFTYGGSASTGSATSTGDFVDVR
ncbi:calcium-binding protein [Streptomyces sp. NPDC058171]